MFKFIMKDKDGNRHNIVYDQHTSKMVWEENNNVVVFPKEGYDKLQWPTAKAISKDNPGYKIPAPSKLKIQLGLSCNYNCSYCLQRAEIHKASTSSTNDAKIFLKTLDTWMTGVPDRIEFWGGEPFLYWHKLKILIPELRQRFPKVDMLIITNGTLLTNEIIDKICEWDIGIGISHDGPGHHLRGEDLFDIPEQREMVEKLMTLRPGKMSFNAVITNQSYDMKKTIEWFTAKYPDANVSFEGVVHDYEEGSNSRFTDKQLNELTQNVFLQMLYGEITNVGIIQNKMTDFINSLLMQRPSHALTQKCGMDREDYLAVDLLGNVMTCQNTGGIGEHKIGHVRSLDKVALTTSTHWSLKEECQSCPVLQLCKGSCMYLEGEQWAASCNAEFAINKGILAGTLFIITGMILEKIEGNMIRPTIPKSNDMEITNGDTH